MGTPLDNPPRPTTSHRRTLRQKWALISLPNKLIVIATVVIAAATVVNLFVAWAMWKEVRKGGLDTHDLAVAAKAQAGKMSDVSNAADKIREAANNMVVQDQRIADNAKDSLNASNRQSKASLDATVDNFKREERAWVGFQGIADSRGFTETEPWKVTVVFFNSGRTPARNVQSSGMYTTSPIPISGPSEQNVKQLVFRPAQSIAPQGNYRQNFGADTPAEAYTLSQKQGQQILVSQYSLIKTKQLFLYYFGVLKYDDVFGNHRQTEYCIYLANPDTKEAGVCDTFNDVN